MAKFQLIALTPRSGKAKATQKDYSLLVAEGVYTDNDGVMSTCELVFFADKDGKLPVYQIGKVYEPVTKTFVNRDKKLTAGVYELRELKAA